MARWDDFRERRESAVEKYLMVKRQDARNRDFRKLIKVS